MRVSELIELLGKIDGDPPVVIWADGIGGNINLEAGMIEHYTPKGGKASLIIEPNRSP